MSPDAHIPTQSDGTALALARERFLQVETLEAPEVRQAILASWWRSREWKVAADRLELKYVRDPNLDTPLTRSADPVLRHLRDQLDGQPLAIVLTDPTGVVLSRHTADKVLERHLDQVHLAPGFSYAEASAGTNGIGTALEAGRAMQVFGHEHYAENLEDLACAGVPIRHPMSGKTVGVLDLTCWRRDAGPLLMTLAKTTAEQIRQALLAEAGIREIELLHAYMRACRHSSGMVFALNNDVVMMNDNARDTLPAGDQSALLRLAAEALAERRTSTTVELPSGVQVRLTLRPVATDAGVAGGVVDVKLTDPVAAVAAGGQLSRMLLPGLVGNGPLWRRACSEAETLRRTGRWLIVEGESGTGRASLAQAASLRVDPGRGCSLLEAPATAHVPWMKDAQRTLAEKDAVVLRHLDRLPQTALRVLSGFLGQTAQRPNAWVAVIAPTEPPSAELQQLLRMFPSTVEVPPLRHHIEDVEQLVTYFLLRLGCSGQLVCSTEVMQLLVRYTWPGNAAQLLEALRWVLRHRRTGVVQVGDLPPEIRSLSRRRLTTLESLERDAIVLGLQDANGNKAGTARALGMSRATVYRKIREYGIVC